MSNDLTPYISGGLVRDARRAGRAISRVQSQGQVRQAQVDVDAEVSLAKVDAVTSATGQAMGAICRVAQAEQQLAQVAPLASGRLAYLADRHMLAMGDVLDDLRREVRRR